VLAYSIAMIVNFGSKAGTLDPVPDFSRLVVVSCDLAYALLLETSLVIAAFNLARTESNPVVRSRLLIFLGATTLLVCLWTVAVVLTCLYYTVDVSAFGKAHACCHQHFRADHWCLHMRLLFFCNHRCRENLKNTRWCKTSRRERARYLSCTVITEPRWS
jgi:hypothetical protein